MRIIQKHLYGKDVAVSDNTRSNARKQAELAFQNRTRTVAQVRKEEADKRAENAIKEREARRKDPGYDEKKRKAEVDKLLKEINNGKYTSNKKSFIGRFADNIYHNSGVDYYVNRAKELAKEGANPITQLANAGLGVIGTAFNSTMQGYDTIGNLKKPNSNVASNLMGVIAETPVGTIPAFMMKAGREYAGASGETGAELLATMIPVGRGRPVRVPAGQRGVPTIRIQGNGTPLYYWAKPNPDRLSRSRIGSNLFEDPMSKAEIAEAIQNGTMQYADLNGNVLGTWRNIDLNGGVHVLMIPTRNGGRFLPNDRATIYLPNGLAVEVDATLAREYLNGTSRYPSLLNEAQTLELSRLMRGTSAEFEGYGIRGPRYRINYGDGQSLVYRYPEIENIFRDRSLIPLTTSSTPLIVPRPSLQEYLRGKQIFSPEEEVAAKWEYLEKYANNPESVRSVRLALERARDDYNSRGRLIRRGENIQDILSKLSNELIDYLADNGMLNIPNHTRNMTVIFDHNTGNVRPLTQEEVLRSVNRDWENRVHGSMFDFANTNSYSYQSHLRALLALIKKVKDKEARLLRPGNTDIYPNNYASIRVPQPNGREPIIYLGDNNVGRSAGPMDLDKLNKHYRNAYDKLNELGREQYGNKWSDIIFEDITPDQLHRQYDLFEDPRKHVDVRAVIYKNGGKQQLYNRRLISKIKGV